MLYLVLLRGRKAYHYLFAAFLLICAIWDLGIFLIVIRNSHLEELVTIGRIAILPCMFIPALIFHFANLYTGRPIKWAIALVWGVTGVLWVLIIAGVFYRIEGVYSFNWGNIFRVHLSVVDPIFALLWFGANLSACWLLYQARKRSTSVLERRHYLYIVVGFLAVTFASVKGFIPMGLNLPILLPLGMLLNDIFVSIIGVAIIKDRLFDITVIVKKGTLYSLLAGVLIFVYSFTEHLLVTYIGERIVEHSYLLHLIAIGIGIAVMMPVKSRLERAIERYFAHKALEF